ncbi:hypothetical protein NL676_022084 [Syzygium grande]|nr:hypothetical protein NL676_022084 [Syzygium grande]
MDSPQKPPQAHTLLFPLPLQGHITPMLQFAKPLVSRGLKSHPRHHPPPLEIHTHRPPPPPPPPPSISRPSPIVKAETASPRATVAVVYDGFMPWALDVAKQCKKLGVAFFTQTCAANNIYYHVQRGLLGLPLSGGSVEVPGLPPLEPSEMPSFLYKLGSYPGSYDMVIKQFSNVGDADLVLFNTIYELEKEVLTHKFALACCCHSFCKNYSFESTHHIIRWI